MKKSFLIILSLVILLSSVLTVVASAETSSLPDDMFDDDMYDDDVNVTYSDGTTATTKGGLLGNLGGDGIGDLIGGVVESVFQDEDISEQVNNEAQGIFDSLGGIFDGIKDLGSLIPTTKNSSAGGNFFDTIDPVVTGGFNSGSFGSGGGVQNNSTISSTDAAINGESVDFNTTVNPYAKPTAGLNPGDKSDSVKWLQWVLIYTECGLPNNITGEYDDATAAAVKTLQLKYGMNVDGIASTEVIEKAEQMYNDYINGVAQQGTSAPAVFNTVGGSTQQGGKPGASADLKVTIIIVVLIILWIFAIAAVFIIIHIKRKNITLSDDGEIIKPEKEKKAKKTRRTKELQDSIPLRSSKTLKDLAAEKAVENENEEEAEEAVKSEPSTDESEKAEVEIEPVSEEKNVPEEKETSEEKEVSEKKETSEEKEASEEKEVSEEKEAPEEKEVSEEEAVPEEKEIPEEKDIPEEKNNQDEITFEVVDLVENFNSFNHFNYSDDDDGEIRVSSSLYEMKQRKAQLEAKAKEQIVNSTNEK